MSKLVIVVPAGRRRSGRALLLANDGRTRLGPLRMLATASRWVAARHDNPDCDWSRPFGHTPTGSYVVSASLPPGVMPNPKKRPSRFGRLGALVLEPVAGNALEASRRGRTRFLLHGGPLDARDRLRPTFGGLRLADRDLGALFAAINEANADHDAVSAVEVVETTAPSWTDEGVVDEVGKRRSRRASQPAGPRGGTRRLSVKHAALLTLGFGVAGRRIRKGEVRDLGSVDRRDFVGLALLALGAVGAEGCTSPYDATPACKENPCGPGDAGRDGASIIGDGGLRDGALRDDGGGPDGGYEGGHIDGGTGGTGGGGTGGGGTGSTAGDTGTTGNVGTAGDTGAPATGGDTGVPATGGDTGVPATGGDTGVPATGGDTGTTGGDTGTTGGDTGGDTGTTGGDTGTTGGDGGTEPGGGG